MRPGKRNGFSLPFHRLQVISWVVVALLSGLFYSVIGVNLESEAQIVVFCGYSMMLALCLLCGFLCTLCDPTDVAVKMRYSQKNYAYEFNSSQFPRLCTRCNTHVGAQSKHCNKCNRCTAMFDHHCDWLNNCIGAGNYRLFVGLLGTVEGWVNIELAVTLYYMSDIFRGQGDTLIAHYSLGDKGYCFVIMLMVTAIICVMVALGTGYLIVFHVWLRVKGITTYEFIVERRKKNRVEQSPQPQASQRKSNNSSIAVELSASVPEVRPELTPSHEHHDASPSQSSDPQSLKKLFSRTIDNSSFPSCQERPTDMDSSFIIKRRKARETVMSPAGDDYELEGANESGDMEGYKTGPLPSRPDFP